MTQDSVGPKPQMEGAGKGSNSLIIAGEGDRQDLPALSNLQCDGRAPAHAELCPQGPGANQE